MPTKMFSVKVAARGTGQAAGLETAKRRPSLAALENEVQSINSIEEQRVLDFSINRKVKITKGNGLPLKHVKRPTHSALWRALPAIFLSVMSFLSLDTTWD
jgi:hypothetical protein